VQVFEYNGNQYVQRYGFSDPGIVGGILVSDFFGDGTYKLIYATATGGSCPSASACLDRIVILNADTGEINYTVTPGGYVLVQPIATNLDSDSRLELVTIEKNAPGSTLNPSGKIRKFDIDPPITVSSTYPQTGTIDLSLTTPTAADVNNDGSYEIIYGKGGGQVIILSKNLALQRTYSLGGTIAAAPAVGDWDNDGYAEIAVKRKTTTLDVELSELIDTDLFPDLRNISTEVEDSVSFSLFFIDAFNKKPSIAPLRNLTGKEGNFFSVYASVFDPNNNPLEIIYGFPFNSSGEFLPNSSQTQV